MTFSALNRWVGRLVLALALAMPVVTTGGGAALAHGYHGGYHHHGYYKKRRRNRDVALGVIGGVLALGTIAAIANSNRRYRDRRYYRSDRRYYRGGGSCDYWANQCARNWGTRNNNFYGCLRYHRC